MKFFRPRYRRSQRRLGFESLETRQLLSAQAIHDENQLAPASIAWKVPNPPDAPTPLPGLWKYNGSTDDELESPTRIQGYTSRPSYNLGEPVEFKIDSESSYNVDIFRLGWYGGVGA